MKTTKKLLIFMVLLVSLLSISAVSAADVNDTAVDVVGDDITDIPTIPDDTADTPESPVENDTTDIPVENSTEGDNGTEIPIENSTEGDNGTDIPIENSTEGDNETTITSPIDAEDLEMFYKNGTRYEVTITDSNGNPLANQTVTITINGVDYTRITDANGIASLAINLNPGIYTVTATFNGTSINSTITVLSTLTSDNVIKYFQNGTQYYVTVVDGQGNPIANQKVYLNINGVIYERITNENGTARLNINLNPGNYIITVTGPNGEMKSNNITVLSKLVSEDLTKEYNKSATYNVTVLDDNGNPVANETVTLNVNGVIYERVTDENGVARLNINLNPGNYIITATCGSSVTSNKITVNKMPTSVKVTSTTINKNGRLEVTVTSNGKPIAGQRVYFVYNDIAYYSISDENGVASIGIGLPEGKYTFMVGILDNMFYANALVYTTVTVQ
ncbi:MAG: Ig-like domain-containing protein [Methanobrevibacter woesei]|uniref:Ig-like domain-containing protein n=1 Tax=Methanobrevibacter woesei TaxID=190976 RepID=UPI0023EF5D8B|nr:Ig-like domain-containing protein [Methanobrevibacter woesei]MCI7291046.1 Ig-like domain-containing protein [Methanobrevibacter woesei]